MTSKARRSAAAVKQQPAGIGDEVDQPRVAFETQLGVIGLGCLRLEEEGCCQSLPLVRCRRRLTPSSALPSLAGGRRCGDAVQPARRQPSAGPRPETTAGPGRVVGRTGARRQPAAQSVTPARRWAWWRSLVSPCDERDEGLSPCDERDGIRHSFLHVQWRCCDTYLVLISSNLEQAKVFKT